jgi:hypothetical protein
MEVFDSEPWAFGLTLHLPKKKKETLQIHGVKTVGVLSDSQAAIRQAAHLEPGRVQGLARRINRWARSLLAHSIGFKIQWVP